MRPVLKFAVVREDPQIELDLVARFAPASVLTVASGGCTAFALLAARDDLAVTAFDLNPTQLEHAGRRLAAIRAGDTARLGVAHDHPDDLHECGAFEGLFRVWRTFLREFVAPPAAWERLFDPTTTAAEHRDLYALVTGAPYWPASFTTAFNDGLLHAMFGPAATQHAVPGSYPGYFQRRLEDGLGRPDAARNPFLQHLLLGRYRAEDAPAFLQCRTLAAPRWVLGSLEDVGDLGAYDLVSLSNVLDWSDDTLAAAWMTRLRALRRGSVVVVRQLNNQRDLTRFLGEDFVLDTALGDALTARERALFYERVLVAVRR